MDANRLTEEELAMQKAGHVACVYKLTVEEIGKIGAEL